MPKKKIILEVVEKHIGGQQCDNITAHALAVYNSLVKQEKSLKKKMEINLSSGRKVKLGN